jgi:predicted FMN-binding regulatory protein PaiB
MKFLRTTSQLYFFLVVYDHENVPTWNYIAVHVYGKKSIIEGEAVESLKAS